MQRRLWILGGAAASLALVVLAGCYQTAERNADGKETNLAARDTDAARTAEHGHTAGRHGGTVVEIGRDNYHAEAIFGENGLVRLHLLAKDEAQIQEVDQQTLTAFAKAEGDVKGVEFELKPTPRPDDSKGKTSVFEGTLPGQLRDKWVEVTVTTIRIEGGRFRFAFRNFAEGQHNAAAMPGQQAGEKLRKLYATVKGKYTEADVRANGPGVTARQKYGNEVSQHDDDPQPGDRICPISRTKANPKFTWVVGGQTYQFCCTPCIDEFVRKAQEKPDEVKQPGDYVKR